MTAIERNTDAERTSGRSASPWPDFAELQVTAVKSVGFAALTFVLGALTTAALREPFETRFIPAVLEHIREPLRLNMYAQKADGSVRLDGCYKLLTLPWSSYGQMVEILDPKACPGTVIDPDDTQTPNMFKLHWTENGGVMSFAFNPFVNRFGGGVFTGDATSTPGVYIGSLAGQSHAKLGQPCQLTHYWAVVGEKDRIGAFEHLLTTRITGADGKVAMLPGKLENSGGTCTGKSGT